MVIMPHMNPHSLEILEFESVKKLISGYSTGALGRELALEMAPLNDINEIKTALALSDEVKTLLEKNTRR